MMALAPHAPGIGRMRPGQRCTIVCARASSRDPKDPLERQKQVLELADVDVLVTNDPRTHPTNIWCKPPNHACT
jgi:hypothetical protein